MEISLNESTIVVRLFVADYSSVNYHLRLPRYATAPLAMTSDHPDLILYQENQL